MFALMRELFAYSVITGYARYQFEQGTKSIALFFYIVRFNRFNEKKYCKKTEACKPGRMKTVYKTGGLFSYEKPYE